MKITIEGADAEKLLAAIGFEKDCQVMPAKTALRERMAFRLPTFVTEKLRKYAEDHGVTATHVVTTALVNYLFRSDTGGGVA